MACLTVASVSVATPAAVVAQLGESRVLSRQGGVALAAPKAGASKLVLNKSRVVMSSALPQKEQNLAGLTSVALLVSAIIPELAEAAQPGISPSLKNLLLSVVAGGIVTAGLAIAVAGVSTFDPVKRR